jgi:superfamily II DNA/RNA helicase
MPPRCRLLPRVFGPILGRIPRPTPIQERGIPPILEGRDVLLSAPMASGKREAFTAPLVEGLLGSDRGPLSVVIVSPTRALANDLKRRLEVLEDPLRHRFPRRR